VGGGGPLQPPPFLSTAVVMIFKNSFPRSKYVKIDFNVLGDRYCGGLKKVFLDGKR
jgi:hypothetical protein